MKGEYVMKHLSLMLAALVVAGLASSCTKTDNKTAVRVGQQVVTVKMVKDAYLGISPSARPDLKTIDEKEAFAKDIASKEIMMTEARKMGLDRVPEITRMRAESGMQKAWQVYYEDQIRSQVKVTEKDERDLYAKQNLKYHLGWILVRSKALADEVSARIKSGEDFGKLATLASVDPSRAASGDIGTRTLGTMPPAVEDKIMAMAPGEVSGAIPFDAYFIILKLFEKVPNEPAPFDQSIQGLESTIRASEENARQRQLGTELRKAYELTFNKGAVELIVSKTRAANPTLGTNQGVIPAFSDEEMDRELAKWKGGTCKIKNYVDIVKGFKDFMRPGYYADAPSVESLVSDYLTGQLWQIEIKAKGYDARPEVVREADRSIEEAMITSLHDNLVKDVKVDSAKVAAFYAEHKSEMVTEPGMRLAVIVSKDEASSKAAYDRLKAGTKFEAVAKEASIDRETGDKGGELPSALANEDVERLPDLQEVVKNLEVGGYSTPMPVPAGFGPEGYMIVKVLERLAPKQLTLADVHKMLSSQILQTEQDGVFSQWLKSKMDEYKVEIYPDALEAVDFTQLKSQGV
jgi:peptidyl-prolyl cis-trans isomerase C